MATKRLKPKFKMEPEPSRIHEIALNKIASHWLGVNNSLSIRYPKTDVIMGQIKYEKEPAWMLI